MSSYDQLVEQAFAMTQSGTDFGSALQLWIQALDSGDCPQRPEAVAEVQLNAAVCCCHLEDFEQAMAFCSDALELQQSVFADWSDDIQRTFAIYADAAIAAGDFAQALEVSDMALSALAENPEECEPYTFSMVAQKRAALALEMGEPDAAEDALQFALDQLELFIGMEEPAEELLSEVWLQKARVLEVRAENRLLGGAGQLGELDILEAVRCLEEAGVTEGEQYQRLQAMQGTLAGLDDL